MAISYPFPTYPCNRIKRELFIVSWRSIINKRSIFGIFLIRVTINCLPPCFSRSDLFVASIRLLGKCYTRRDIITSGKYPLAFSGSCYFHACNIELELSWIKQAAVARKLRFFFFLFLIFSKFFDSFSPPFFLSFFSTKRYLKLHGINGICALVWRTNFLGIEFLFQGSSVIYLGQWVALKFLNF